MKTVSYIEDLEQWKQAFNFSIPIKIRFSETDMFGHVNNVSAFIYFEEARIEFLKSKGLFTLSSSPASTFPIVADLQCDYHKQIYLHDQLDLYVKADYIGNTSFDIHYMGVEKERGVLLTGRGRMVQVDTKTGKKVPLSKEMKEKLTK
ncbi:acyl-CoA thioesterase [Sediminibacillus massiliensis]|uniref:acyl-CoA thioesterase n=1 Tax=Sediminibacillus massiliensis TaxID=1926277 RepID=UPI00098850E3|nr:thioesterase family protein [Sediminibacillus massiliensis]